MGIRERIEISPLLLGNKKKKSLMHGIYILRNRSFERSLYYCAHKKFEKPAREIYIYIYKHTPLCCERATVRPCTCTAQGIYCVRGFSVCQFANKIPG